MVQKTPRQLLGLLLTFACASAAASQEANPIFSPATDQVRNGGLGVRVMFVGKNVDKKTITISSEIANIAEEPIFISLVGPPPVAIDTQGVTYNFIQAAGVPQCRFLDNTYISHCFTNHSNYLPGSAFTLLQAGASAIVATTFTADQASTSGFLSVTMNMAVATGTRPADGKRKGTELENVAISFPLIDLGVVR